MKWKQPFGRQCKWAQLQANNRLHHSSPKTTFLARDSSHNPEETHTHCHLNPCHTNNVVVLVLLESMKSIGKQFPRVQFPILFLVKMESMIQQWYTRHQWQVCRRLLSCAILWTHSSWSSEMKRYWIELNYVLFLRLRICYCCCAHSNYALFIFFHFHHFSSSHLLRFQFIRLIENCLWHMFKVVRRQAKASKVV